jgi:large subunit ribosomal protein L21
MYAVIETGGKQYRVELGSELAVERLDGAPGDTIKFDRVLLVADGDTANIGTPVVGDALVTASLVRHDRGDKVTVFKYRPKARHRAKRGHRQEQTVVRVADISFGGRSAADEAKVEQKEASKAKARAAAEAEKKATADQALAAKLEREAQERTAKAKAAAKADDKPAPKAKSEPKAKAAPKTPAKSKTAAPAKPASKKTTAKPAARKKDS